MSRNYVIRTKRTAFHRAVSSGKAQTLPQVIYKPASVSFGEAGMSHCLVLASQALRDSRASASQGTVCLTTPAADWSSCSTLGVSASNLCGEVMRFALLAYGM